MADWEEQNKRMTKTGEGDDEKEVVALDEGDIALLQVRLSLLGHATTQHDSTRQHTTTRQHDNAE